MLLHLTGLHVAVVGGNRNEVVRGYWRIESHAICGYSGAFSTNLLPADTVENVISLSTFNWDLVALLKTLTEHCIHFSFMRGKTYYSIQPWFLAQMSWKQFLGLAPVFKAGEQLKTIA